MKNEIKNKIRNEEDDEMMSQIDIYDRPSTRLRKLADVKIPVYQECPVVKLSASGRKGIEESKMIFVKDLKENPIGTAFSVGQDIEYPEYRNTLLILNKTDNEVHLMYISSGFDVEGDDSSLWKEEKEFIFKFNS